MTSTLPQSTPISGADYLRSLLEGLPKTPGVYRMSDTSGTVLYVGKARNLQKRVTSYTQIHRMPIRLQRMVALTHHLEVILTDTEAEALLLEATLIKKFAPKFNILLKDDKSFPYLALRLDTPWPQLVKHRGVQKPGALYFGPFASTTAVNETLDTLQKVFQLRTCSDYTVAHRARPCLQYHLKRCAAPCVGKIALDAYMTCVEDLKACLRGNSRVVHEALIQKMQAASDAQRYEEAANYRNRAQALMRIQTESTPSLADGDVFSVERNGGVTCVQVFFYRNHQCYGNRTYFPQNTAHLTPEEVVEMVMGQIYQRTEPPALILTNTPLPGAALLAEALSLKRGSRVTLETPQRGAKRQLMAQIQINTHSALERHLIAQTTTHAHLTQLQALFKIDHPIERIEIYDNSHSMGHDAYGVMVVASPDGFERSAYRKFRPPKDLTPGDDVGMMRHVLTQRFQSRTEDAPLPDLILLDGGAGQLKAGVDVLGALGLLERIRVVGIAKGVERNAGRERFFMDKIEPFTLPINDPLLHYLQRLRDESHRFAIGAHRARKTKSMQRSRLDDIPGIGPRRKQALLRHFGSLEEVRKQSVQTLSTAPGINQATAQVIFDFLRE